MVVVLTGRLHGKVFLNNLPPLPLSHLLILSTLRTQERIIERLKDQREREDRERLEEVDSYKKENKDLKEKVNSLQIELTEKEVSAAHREVPPR